VSRGTARRILLLNLAGSLVLSMAIGLRADTPAWSPITWGILFLALTVFAGGPIALILEWRATRGWTQPNPHRAERVGPDELVGVPGHR
jgi:hypothetical protein